MRSGLADVDEKTLEASVSYGHGPAAPYAVVQHERTDFRHSEGRRAKWLELALVENRARYQSYIAEQIRKALRGGYDARGECAVSPRQGHRHLRSQRHQQGDHHGEDATATLRDRSAHVYGRRGTDGAAR